jgi:hypothetical protein
MGRANLPSALLSPVTPYLPARSARKEFPSPFCPLFLSAQTFRYFGRSRMMSGSAPAIARSERKKVR